jgi:YVTN family beta-propeller protein
MMRRGLIAIAALCAAAMPAAPAHAQRPARDVVFVANGESGTVSVVDARTLAVLKTIDVIPDGPDAMLGVDDPLQALAGQKLVEAAGGNNYAQDQDVSPDGRTLYVSRGHRGDVAAFDIATGRMLWKLPIPGLRSDHMTISPDGARLYVSALTRSQIVVIDTQRRARIALLPTGEWPHDNHLSRDGTRLYNGSIGNIVIPRGVRDLIPAGPFQPAHYQLTVIATSDLRRLRTYRFGAGVRPYVITRDDRRMYAQLSMFHGLIEFDLDAGRITRTLSLPIDAGVTEDDFDFEAPHHGLALSSDEGTLCVAGRASDYVALVSTATLTTQAIIDVGDAPSWAATSPAGDLCFVANTRDDTLSAISFAQRSEVARISVGDGPKHLEPARVPADALTG